MTRNVPEIILAERDLGIGIIHKGEAFPETRPRIARKARPILPDSPIHAMSMFLTEYRPISRPGIFIAINLPNGYS